MAALPGRVLRADRDAGTRRDCGFADAIHAPDAIWKTAADGALSGAGPDCGRADGTWLHHAG
ncbi:hypothetical protein D3C81_2306900 [compost metagenome]